MFRTRILTIKYYRQCIKLGKIVCIYSMHIINTLFNNIYVLYITDSEVYSVKKNIQHKNISVEYFLGFDGSKSVPPNNIKKGEFGHLNSFINILNDAKRKNYDKILILESDVYFCKNFEEELNKIPLDYNLLYLGCTQNKYYSQSTWPTIDKIKIPGQYSAYKTLGTFAVAIHSNIFDELIVLLSGFSAPTDVLFTRIQEKYKSIVIYPNLISCNVIKSSTKGGESFRDQVKFMKLVRWNLRDMEFINNYKLNFYKENLYEKSSLLYFQVSFTVNSKLPNYYIKFSNNEYPVITDISILKNIFTVNRRKYLNLDNKYKIIVSAKDINNIDIIGVNIFLQDISISVVDKSKILFNLVYIKNNVNSVSKYYSKILAA